MQSDFIAVMGATGNTGRKITEALLRAGENVRALGRSESKLAKLKLTGVEVLVGDTNDAAFLIKAFSGADAVYTLQAKALVQAGLSESFARLYVEMTRAFNDGTIKPVRRRENTTLTGFEDLRTNGQAPTRPCEE
ncbi:MAG TPA: NmrA family NAD(P)-binding protein [Candidatus Udaeobacter sp.]|nr:NmrA family NAD(P)-binding protein [Candidatus Udaeobacter sp.]